MGHISFLGSRYDQTQQSTVAAYAFTDFEARSLVLPVYPAALEVLQTSTGGDAALHWALPLNFFLRHASIETYFYRHNVMWKS